MKLQTTNRGTDEMKCLLTKTYMNGQAAWLATHGDNFYEAIGEATELHKPFTISELCESPHLAHWPAYRRAVLCRIVLLNMLAEGEFSPLVRNGREWRWKTLGEVMFVEVVE